MSVGGFFFKSSNAFCLFVCGLIWFGFWDKVWLCRPCWPDTHYVNQAGPTLHSSDFELEVPSCLALVGILKLYCRSSTPLSVFLDSLVLWFGFFFFLEQLCLELFVIHVAGVLKSCWLFYRALCPITLVKLFQISNTCSCHLQITIIWLIYFHVSLFFPRCSWLRHQELGWIGVERTDTLCLILSFSRLESCWLEFSYI